MIATNHSRLTLRTYLKALGLDLVTYTSYDRAFKEGFLKSQNARNPSELSFVAFLKCIIQTLTLAS